MEEKNKKIADAPAADEKNTVSPEEVDSSVSDEAAAQAEFAFLLEGAEERVSPKKADDDFSLLIKDAAEKAEAAVHGEFAFIMEETPEEEEEPKEQKQEESKSSKKASKKTSKKSAKKPPEETLEKPAEEPAKIPDEKSADPKESAPSAKEDTASESPAAEPAPKKEKSILGICLPLVFICMAVALMLSAVNLLTKDIIAANAAAEKQNAVFAIFPEADGASLYEKTGTEEVYLALRNNELVGCCIGLSENGFGGAISLLVGLDTNGAVSGIEIISMSETPGIGSKAKNDSFLSRYKGSEPFVIGENLDAISGATITSRAITRAVNRALEIPLDFTKMASGMGLSVHTAAETKTAEPVPEEKPAETTAAPVPAETTAAPETTETTAAAAAPAETTTAVPAPASVQPISHTKNTNPVQLVSEETVYTAETEQPAETEIPETDTPEKTTTAESTAAAETANP